MTLPVFFLLPQIPLLFFQCFPLFLDAFFYEPRLLQMHRKRVSYRSMGLTIVSLTILLNEEAILSLPQDNH